MSTAHQSTSPIAAATTAPAIATTPAARPPAPNHGPVASARVSTSVSMHLHIQRSAHTTSSMLATAATTHNAPALAPLLAHKTTSTITAAARATCSLALSLRALEQLVWAFARPFRAAERLCGTAERMLRCSGQLIRSSGQVVRAIARVVCSLAQQIRVLVLKWRE